MARDGAFDDRFKAALEAAGLRLTAEEASGVEKLAAWMHDGLAVLEHPQSLARHDEDICDLDIFALGARLRDGRLTAKALTEATLARIAERDPAYLSFYRVLEERALAEAAQADRELAEGLDRGPLHGVPVGIKDLIDDGQRAGAGRCHCQERRRSGAPPAQGGCHHHRQAGDL